MGQNTKKGSGRQDSDFEVDVEDGHQSFDGEGTTRDWGSATEEDDDEDMDTLFESESLTLSATPSVDRTLPLGGAEHSFDDDEGTLLQIEAVARDPESVPRDLRFADRTELEQDTDFEKFTDVADATELEIDLKLELGAAVAMPVTETAEAPAGPTKKVKPAGWTPPSNKLDLLDAPTQELSEELDDQRTPLAMPVMQPPPDLEEDTGDVLPPQVERAPPWFDEDPPGPTPLVASPLNSPEEDDGLTPLVEVDVPSEARRNSQVETDDHDEATFRALAIPTGEFAGGEPDLPGLDGPKLDESSDSELVVPQDMSESEIGADLLDDPVMPQAMSQSDIPAADLAAMEPAPMVIDDEETGPKQVSDFGELLFEDSSASQQPLLDKGNVKVVMGAPSSDAMPAMEETVPAPVATPPAVESPTKPPPPVSPFASAPSSRPAPIAARPDRNPSIAPSRARGSIKVFRLDGNRAAPQSEPPVVSESKDYKKGSLKVSSASQKKGMSRIGKVALVIFLALFFASIILFRVVTGQ